MNAWPPPRPNPPEQVGASLVAARPPQRRPVLPILIAFGVGAAVLGAGWASGRSGSADPRRAGAPPAPTGSAAAEPAAGDGPSPLPTVAPGPGGTLPTSVPGADGGLPTNPPIPDAVAPPIPDAVAPPTTTTPPTTATAPVTTVSVTTTAAPATTATAAPQPVVGRCVAGTLGESFFATDIAVIADADLPELLALVPGLAAVSGTIHVDGHTDSRPSTYEGGNEALSRDRAQAVGDALEAAGIDPARIVVDGHADREPATTGTDAASLAANRRVVISVECPAVGP